MLSLRNENPKPVLFWLMVCIFAIAVASVLTGAEGFVIDKPRSAVKAAEKVKDKKKKAERAEAHSTGKRESPIAWVPIEYLNPKTYEDVKLSFTEPDESVAATAASSGRKPGRFKIVAYTDRCVADHCRRQMAAVGDGDEFVSVTYSEEPCPDFIKKKLPPLYLYPVYVWQPDATHYQWPGVSDMSYTITKQDLRKWCEESNAIREGDTTFSAAAMPKIAGGDLVRRWLNDIERIAGPKASCLFTWRRIGGKQDLLVNDTHSRLDLFGMDGEIQFECVTKHGTSKNEFKFHVPDESVQEAYGSPLLIVWTVVSTGKMIYDLCHPKVSVWLPETVVVNAKMDCGKALVDFGNDPPAVKLHWSFWLGLLKYEYKRPLTGLIIDQHGVTALFQRSSIYKDVTFPFAT